MRIKINTTVIYFKKRVCIKIMNVCILKALYYDRIDVSEGIDVNETSVSSECHICHYWYFLKYSFIFQPNVFNRCNDLVIMSINLSNIAFLNIKGHDYCCIISLISKNEAITLMQNADLTEKSETLENIKNLFSYIKVGKEVLTFGNTEIEKNNF